MITVAAQTQLILSGISLERTINTNVASKNKQNASIEYININFIIPIYSNSQDIYMQSKTLHLESLNQKYTPYMPVVSNKSPTQTRQHRRGNTDEATQTRQHVENFKLATCSINCCIECYKQQAVTCMLDIHM